MLVTSSEGVWLEAAGGRRILDAGGGAIVSNIGHGRPEIAEVAAHALRRLDYVVPIFATESRVALVNEVACFVVFLTRVAQKRKTFVIFLRSPQLLSFFPIDSMRNRCRIRFRIL